MNLRSTLRLARADLSLGRTAALVYAALAAVGAIVNGVPDPTARSLGLSLVLCVLIGQCFHLPIVSVFHDLARGTRAFTLSLPVTPAEYAAGKLLATALLFLVPAAGIVLAMLARPASEQLLPPPMLALVLLGWLVFFVQNLGLAMLTESMGATIAVLLTEIFVIGNGIALVAPRSPWCLRFWGELEGGGPVRVLAFGVLAIDLVASGVSGDYPTVTGTTGREILIGLLGIVHLVHQVRAGAQGFQVLRRLR